MEPLRAIHPGPLPMQDLKDRTFAPEALLLGLGVFVYIAVFGFFNDFILKQMLSVGNHFPVGGLLYFLPVVLLWNPLMLRQRYDLPPCQEVLRNKFQRSQGNQGPWQDI